MHHIFASTSLEQSRWRSLGEPRCGEMGGSGWHGRLGCDLANSQPAKPALLLLFMLARSWAVDVSALFTCVMRAMVAPAMAANMCTPLVFVVCRSLAQLRRPHAMPKSGSSHRCIQGPGISSLTHFRSPLSSFHCRPLLAPGSSAVLSAPHVQDLAFIC